MQPVISFTMLRAARSWALNRLPFDEARIPHRELVARARETDLGGYVTQRAWYAQQMLADRRRLMQERIGQLSAREARRAKHERRHPRRSA